MASKIWKPGLVHEFEKSDSERVKFSLKEFHGHKLVDIRVYYETDEGEFRPSPRGISVNIRFVDELVEGVEKLRVALLRIEKNAHPAPEVRRGIKQKQKGKFDDD